MANTEQFLKRYHNHINITGFGVPGQEALAKSKVLVAGLADLASPVLSYLAAAGIGTIGIASDEKVRQEDLASQPILNNSHEGKLKGQAAASQLREINPDLKIMLHEEALSDSSVLSVLANYDTVIDTGTDLSRSLLINDACVMLGKPMVYGSLFYPSGHFGVFNFKGGATLRCMLSNDIILNLTMQEQKHGFGSLAAIVGGFLANEVIKIVGEIGEVASSKLFILNSYSNKLDSIRIEPISTNQTISSLSDDYRKHNFVVSDPSPVRGITARLLALKMKYKESIQLVDIREYQNRSEDVWNFLHIPESEFLPRKDEIHQDIMVVLISTDGESAKRLSALLNEKHGFDNIYYLQGGYQDWVEETNSRDLSYESF